MPNLTLFLFSYYDHWAYGGFEMKEIAVVANTESEALGMILDKYPETTPTKWCHNSVDMTRPNIIELSERSS